jgi:RecA-family ATPase
MADEGKGWSVDEAHNLGAWADLEAWDEADLKPRPWIARGYFIRGAVTTMIGPGGISKSSLALSYAVAMALAVPFQDFRTDGRFRSVIYNSEDDREEQRRRLTAIVTSFGKQPADIAHLIATHRPLWSRRAF